MVRQSYKKVLSEHLRHGNKQQREALLNWVNQPQFADRKPSPDELTKECLRKSSPLYGLMKTDVKTAAQAYWRQTAQDIIRHINVVRVNIRTGEYLSEPVRAWVPIGIDDKGRIPEDNYIPTQRAMKSRATRLTILEQAHKDFSALIARYKRYAEFLKEFSPVLEAYEKLQAELEPAEA